MFLCLLPSLHPLSGPVLAFLRVLVPHVGKPLAWGSTSLHLLSLGALGVSLTPVPSRVA